MLMTEKNSHKRAVFKNAKSVVDFDFTKFLKELKNLIVEIKLNLKGLQ